MSFIASSTSSFLVRPNDEIIVIQQMTEYNIIGIGGSSSAIIGLKIVANLEKRLQIPKTLEATIDGKQSAVIIQHRVNAELIPKRVMRTKIGMSILSYSVYTVFVCAANINDIAPKAAKLNETNSVFLAPNP